MVENVRKNLTKEQFILLFFSISFVLYGFMVE